MCGVARNTDSKLAKYDSNVSNSMQLVQRRRIPYTLADEHSLNLCHAF
jgi:hypothetical protein